MSRVALVLAFVLARPAIARAGAEGEAGAGGLFQVAASTGIASGPHEPSPLFGTYELVRAGWRFRGARSLGIGILFVQRPGAEFFDDRATFEPQLYYREFVRAEGVEGTEVELALGVAPVQLCGESDCVGGYRPVTTFAVGIPLSTSLGDVVARVALAFQLGLSGIDPSASVSPSLGITWVLPGE